MNARIISTGPWMWYSTLSTIVGIDLPRQVVTGACQYADRSPSVTSRDTASPNRHRAGELTGQAPMPCSCTLRERICEMIAFETAVPSCGHCQR
jgi:hypothetical protein